MTDKTKSANTISIPIQDMMVGKSLIPHHIELGYPNPMKDQLVDVKAIDVPVEILLGAGKSVTFHPGSPAANIECITYSCILLNDLTDISDLSDFLPEHPDTVRITIDNWMDQLGSDSLPENWFLQHRNEMILRVHLEISWGATYEPLSMDAGSSWSSIVAKVQKRAQMIELAQSAEIHNIHAEENEAADYSAVQSKPAHSVSKAEDRSAGDRNISDFMTDATGVLNE